MTEPHRRPRHSDDIGERDVRGIRRVATTTGFLVLGLLPVAAAASPDAPPPTTTAVPVAIAQPVTLPAFTSDRLRPVLPETGLMMLVGSGLLALAAVVRRTTRT
jgi:hypothetical protein